MYLIWAITKWINDHEHPWTTIGVLMMMAMDFITTKSTQFSTTIGTLFLLLEAITKVLFNHRNANFDAVYTNPPYWMPKGTVVSMDKFFLMFYSMILLILHLIKIVFTVIQMYYGSSTTYAGLYYGVYAFIGLTVLMGSIFEAVHMLVILRNEEEKMLYTMMHIRFLHEPEGDETPSCMHARWHFVIDK